VDDDDISNLLEHDNTWIFFVFCTLDKCLTRTEQDELTKIKGDADYLNTG